MLAFSLSLTAFALASVSLAASMTRSPYRFEIACLSLGVSVIAFVVAIGNIVL